MTHPLEETSYDAGRILGLMSEGYSYKQSWKHLDIGRLRGWNAKRMLQRDGRWPQSHPEASGPSPGFLRPPTAMPEPAPSKWSIPESKMKRFDDFERLTGDILFLSDLHCPFHSREVVEAALNTADSLGIRHLVLGGDQTDSGTWNAKRGFIRQPYRWQDMAEEYEAILKVCLECFEKITVLPGNHDSYLTGHLKGEVDASWLLSRLFRNEDNRIKFSDYEHADLISGGRKWKLLHGANYSVNALTTAKQYASKYLCSILMGHQHQSEEGFDRSGQNQIICNGGAFDPIRFGYTNVSPRTNPVQTQGYSTIIDGVGRLYKFTNNKPV